MAGRKTDTELRNGRSKFNAALVGLCPCVGNVAEDHRNVATVSHGGTLQEADWSDRNVVRRAPDTSLHRSLSYFFANSNEIYASHG